MSTALEVKVAPDRQKIDLVKQTVARGATDLELQLFLYTAEKTGLDPLLKQIYCIKRKNTKTGKEEMSIQTGIDGYRLIADRTGKYAGNDDYEFDEFLNQPSWAKATVYKMVDGQKCAFSATARWSQYYPGDYQGFMWKKMPHVMLGKCAESLALRKAFPAELAGIHTFEEMAQADRQDPTMEEMKAGADAYEKEERSAMILEKVERAATIEVPPIPKPQVLPPADKTKFVTISQAQDKRMFAIGKSNGWNEQDIRNVIGRYGFEHPHEVTRNKYEAICDDLSQKKSLGISESDTDAVMRGELR